MKLDQPSYIGMQLCVNGTSLHKPRAGNTPSRFKPHPLKTTPTKTDHPPELSTHQKVSETLRLVTPQISSCTINSPLSSKPHTPRSKGVRRRLSARPHPHLEPLATMGGQQLEPIATQLMGEAIPSRQSVTVGNSSGNHFNKSPNRQ